MERIAILLDKIKELNNNPETTVLEIDLMMDYTRVLYADLVERRRNISFANTVASNPETVLPEQKTENQNATSVTEIKTPDFVPASLPYIPPHPKTDIRDRIGINDKYQFISELFGNDKNAYEETLNAVNDSDTKEEALRRLKENTNAYWNEDSESVQIFYKTLSDFFATRS